MTSFFPSDKDASNYNLKHQKKKKKIQKTFMIYLLFFTCRNKKINDVIQKLNALINNFHTAADMKFTTKNCNEKKIFKILHNDNSNSNNQLNKFIDKEQSYYNSDA